MDWFFLQNYGKGPGFWKQLTDEKITAYMTLTNEKEKTYWETFGKILSKLFGGK